MSSLIDFYNNVGVRDFEGYSAMNLEETKFLKDIVNSDSITNVMEIGFNAGHSAETFLSSNKNIKLVSFDIGYHHYVKLGKEFIDNNYPNRHELILGNSLDSIPEYINKNNNKTFDLIFIDGGHDYNTAKKDLLNCKKLSHKNTIVIMDDTMNNKEWVNYWNVGPNQAWTEAIEYNFVTGLGSKDFSQSHGLSWGKYVHN